jgi:hypothetical protein
MARTKQTARTAPSHLTFTYIQMARTVVSIIFALSPHIYIYSNGTYQADSTHRALSPHIYIYSNGTYHVPSRQHASPAPRKQLAAKSSARKTAVGVILFLLVFVADLSCRTQPVVSRSPRSPVVSALEQSLFVKFAVTKN